MTEKQAQGIAQSVEKAFVDIFTGAENRDIMKAVWNPELHPRGADGKFCAADGMATAGGSAPSGTGITNSTPEEFAVAVAAAQATCPPEKAWRVSAYDADHYKSGIKVLHVTEGGSCFAVTEDGDIVSVCGSANDSQTRGRDLMRMAVENGGVKLDSFAGNHGFYTKMGFEPVSWTPFNEEYAPPGWKAEYQKEPVIFYKYTGNTNQPSVAEFTSKVPPCTGENGYDDAMAIRDNSL